MPIEPDHRRGPDRRRRTRGGRRINDIPLRDPDTCPKDKLHGRGIVLEPIRHHGYIERRHRCKVCYASWRSYQSLMDPMRMTFRAPPVPRTT